MRTWDLGDWNDAAGVLGAGVVGAQAPLWNVGLQLGAVMAACTKVKPGRFEGSGPTKNGSRADHGLTRLGALLGIPQALHNLGHGLHPTPPPLLLNTP